MEWLFGGLGLCGDHRDDMGMAGMTWGPRGQRGQHGVETMETTETTATGTTWQPSGGYGDDVGMTGMIQEQHRDDRDDVGTMVTMWGPLGQ